MSSSCSSSSFCVLRPSEIVKFLSVVVYLEVQRFPMKGWRFESRLRHYLYFNFGFFFRSEDCEKFLSLTDKKERHLTCVNTL